MNNIENQSKDARKPKYELSEATRNRLIKQYENYPTSSGKTQNLRYLHGERLSYRQAVLAKCADCNCGYVDGRHDCRIPGCPLYQFMPYKEQTITNKGTINYG